MPPPQHYKTLRGNAKCAATAVCLQRLWRSAATAVWNHAVGGEGPPGRLLRHVDRPEEQTAIVDMLRCQKLQLM